MKIPNEKLKKILIQTGYITEQNLVDAEKYSSEKKINFIDALYSLELITKDILGQSIAEFYKLKYWDLNSKIPDQSVILQTNPSFARKNNVIVVEFSNKKITISTDNPEKANDYKELFSTSEPHKKIEVVFSLSEDIQDLFRYFDSSLQDKLDSIDRTTGIYIEEYVNTIFEAAFDTKVSDIHIEPDEDQVNIRFRVDGILQTKASITSDLYKNLLNKIKVMSRLRTDLHSQPQDGAIRYKKDSYKFDLRVSIIPLVDGEKVVLRVLSKYVKSLRFSELGISIEGENIIRKASSSSIGMIIVTGPTGSGKTTTLYSLLKEIQSDSLNITSIEDPVEYRISGINQINVNLQTELTFAKGLRSIVRQDPDVIMVGEIRDTETAEIAINAALTGHLVVSTFHANNSATVIPRLIEMGIEPFLISSTINLIVSQRLVRTLCSECKKSKTHKVKDLTDQVPSIESLTSKKEIILFESVGCKVCNFVGFKGRVGIFEYLNMNSDIRELVLKSPSANEIAKLARKAKFKTFYEDGAEKVLNGLTTFDELLRVASPSP